MNQEQSGGQVPEAQVRTGHGFSIIWVVPIVALLIGGWLAYKAMKEKGPVITIAFESADGIEAGKTVIKYKDVEIGKVSTISLLSDLSGVEVVVQMDRDVEGFMTDRTHFWVVRARVAAGEVSGLGTLFSGAYIGCNLSSEGTTTKHFTGLEKPPVLTEGLPGEQFILHSDTLGSLDVGSPVFYRGLRVGKVVDYEFMPDTEHIQLKVFVSAPFHEKVRNNTRFWNASGIDLTLNSSGVKLETQSMVSILIGGIAFDLPSSESASEQAEKDSIFTLYANYESSKERSYAIKEHYLMYFDGSVRGLSPGAPVEIRGIKIGEVVNVELIYDLSKSDFSIPVVAMIEPERLSGLITKDGTVVRGETMDEEIKGEMEKSKATMRLGKLVEKGLRAQLKTGNLLTGQLYIDLEFHPDAPSAQLQEEHGYTVFPTVPVSLERIIQRAENILKEFEQVKFGQLGQSVNDAVQEFKGLMTQLKVVSETVGKTTIPQINDGTLPKVDASLDELRKILAGIDQTLGPGSALSYNVQTLSQELSSTIRSLRSLINMLERDPQALILGKEEKRK